MKIGVIARADQTGLGEMSREFCRYYQWFIDRTALVSRDKPLSGQLPAQNLTHFERHIRPDELQRFADGLDAVIGFETFYCDDAIPTLERLGCQAVMFPMWECSPPDVQAAHLLVSLSPQDARTYPDSYHLDWPIDPSRFGSQKLQRNVKQFQHNSGWGGLNERNNTPAVLQAADTYHYLTGQRVHVRAFRAGPPQPGVMWGPPAEVAEWLYQDAGTMIHLQAFPGLSLPLLEAAAAGIPCLVLDLDGNEHYPEAQRVRVADWDLGVIGGQQIPYGRPSVADLTDKMLAIWHGDVVPRPVKPPPTWPEFDARFWPLLETLCRKNPSTDPPSE